MTLKCAAFKKQKQNKDTMKCPSLFLVQVLPVVSMQCLSEISASRAPCGLHREPAPNLLGQLVFP